MDLNLIFIDFETFYDKKAGYDLKSMSLTEYVRDKRFQVHGCGIKYSDGTTAWMDIEETHSQFHHGIDYSKIAVIGHNIRFDAFILTEKYGIKPAMWIDTQSMARAILGARVNSHSLRSLAEYYGLQAKGSLEDCNVDGAANLSPEQEAALASYCLKDVEICAQLFEIFKKDFPESEYTHMSWTIKAFVEPKLTLNLAQLETEYNEEKTRREEFFRTRDKKEFAANVKFSTMLRDNGISVPYKKSPRTGKQIPALALGDTKFLELLESEDATVRQLCEARVAAKSTLLETRSAKLLAVGVTGSWPFDVQYSGATQTHRYSGSNGAAGNPQNLKPELQRCVEAPPGHLIVSADYAAIEFRILAYLACEQKFIRAICNNEDIYCQFATKFYNRIVTKADEAQRKFGKTSILGLGYGMGVKRFISEVKIKTGQAIYKDAGFRAVNLYRTTYEAIPNYWKYLDKILAKMANDEEGTFLGLPALRFKGPCVILPSGLKLHYMNLRQVPGERGLEWVYDSYKGRRKSMQINGIFGGKFCENLVQALAGEICKIGLDKTEKSGIPVAGQIHDAILAIVPEEKVEEAALAVQSAMEQAIPWFPQLKLQVEIRISKAWTKE